MKFYTKVKQTRKEMIEFLTNHFRYDTMSSWNRSKSYANNVKIHKVIPNEIQNKVFDLMDCEGFYDDLNYLLEDFNIENGYTYQAGFNGRSGGYIVLYNGGKKEKTIFTFKDSSNGRDYADGYGWMDIKEAKERGLYNKTITTVHSFLGQSIDQNEDFTEWSTEDLKERVKLVQSFDKLCDNVVNKVISMAKENEVKEEKYTVTKTRKVIV